MANIVGRNGFTNTKTTRRAIGLIVSNRLRQMGKIQKMVYMNWTTRKWKSAKPYVAFCLFGTKWSSFASYSYREWKVNLFWESQAQKIGVDPGEPSTSTARPNRFGRKTMFCIWYDQKVLNYYELLKSGETVNTKHYRQQLTDLNLCLKEDQNTKRDNKKSFFFMAMFYHILRHVTLEALNWKFLPHAVYSITHQTCVLPFIICLHRWVTHLLSSTVVHTKMWKSDSMKSSRRKGKIFTSVVFINWPKYGERKCIISDWAYFE